MLCGIWIAWKQKNIAIVCVEEIWSVRQENGKRSKRRSTVYTFQMQSPERPSRCALTGGQRMDPTVFIKNVFKQNTSAILFSFSLCRFTLFSLVLHRRRWQNIIKTKLNRDHDEIKFKYTPSIAQHNTWPKIEKEQCIVLCFTSLCIVSAAAAAVDAYRF